MSLPSVSIKRPVTTLMCTIGVVLFGVISLGRLSQELFPPISYPQLSIVTPYENAAPEEIETLITKIIEEAVGSVSGIRKISSTSKEGLSVVIAEFGWNQNMDFASLAIREKLDLVKERLPRDAQEPVVIKYNPFELPVLSISVSSSERTPVALRELARKWFKDEIEKIHGVASAGISGGEEEQILVSVDQAKLKESGVSIVEVSDAVSAANLNYPGGTIKESFYEYLIRTLGEFKKVDEIGQIPIRRVDVGAEDKNNTAALIQGDQKALSGTRLILLKDVAEVQRTVKEKTSFSRFNGLDSVTVAVQKQAQSNTLQIANAIKQKLKNIQEKLPKDIHIDIVYDQSKFIRDALDGVRDAALQGGFLAFLVLVVFLKDFKNSALVVTITPITVLATYTLMYFMNISLNVISLGGVALGVGMLLDNAVVVIENVYRKFRENPAAGMTEAAVTGSNEVMAPMLASTLTTVSVFLPIVFVTGIAGQIFKELAWVVVVTQIISAIIAFTLLPMLIAQLGRKSSLTQRDIHEKDSNPVWNFVSAPIHWIEAGYERVLPLFIRAKWFFLVVICLIFAGSLWVMSSMDRILLPKVDQGQFMVKVDLPVGTRVQFTNEITEKIEEYMRHIPEAKTVAAVVGSNKGGASKEILERLGSHQAQVIVSLKSKRSRSTEDIVQEIRRHFELSSTKNEIRPARVSYVLYDSAFKMGGDTQDAPVVLEVKGPNLEELKRYAGLMKEKISTIEGIYGITDSIAEPFPETKVIINKDRASYYRLSAVTIAQVANVAIKGITSTKFKEENREIDIRIQLKEKDRDSFKKLESIMIHSPLEMEVPLADFVIFKKGKGPSEIKRVSQERTVQVFAKVYGRDLKKVTEDVALALRQIRTPDSYTLKVAGESEEIKESFASLEFAFILSVILVYMIMASQFESLWQPFLIMFCLPLSLIGVAFALWISHTPISVVVILGVILLAGIVVNNGIILIDFINQLRQEGVSMTEAAVRAGKTRLRPILMTAFSSAIGLVPLALGIGEGAELQAPMAVTVMGGILIATFLTLVVTPALYIGTEEIAGFFRRPKSP